MYTISFFSVRHWYSHMLLGTWLLLDGYIGTSITVKNLWTWIWTKREACGINETFTSFHTTLLQLLSPVASAVLVAWVISAAWVVLVVMWAQEVVPSCGENGIFLLSEGGHTPQPLWNKCVVFPAPCHFSWENLSKKGWPRSHHHPQQDSHIHCLLSHHTCLLFLQELQLLLNFLGKHSGHAWFSPWWWACMPHSQPVLFALSLTWTNNAKI